jgi:hypothetical protein
MAAVTEATAKRFFSSPLFAVVGASSNPAKFGHKGSFHTQGTLYIYQ